MSIRVRITLVAGLVVAVALTAAGFLLVSVLQTSQLDTVDATLQARAIDVAGIVERGDLEDVAVDEDDDSFVQILDPDGGVIASSSNVDGVAAIVQQLDGREVTLDVPEVADDPFRVRIDPVDDTDLVIVVGANLEDINEVTAAVRTSLFIGLPILAAFVIVLVWFVAGRALRPVEAIRTEVADITGDELHRRVPQPAADDEIGRLATTMNEMLDRLEASDSARSRFVSDASHELRTPIAVIRHELEIALRDGDTEQLRAAAEDVLDEDLRMQRLVDDLLLLARHDGTRKERIGDAGLVDLDDIVLDVAHRVPSDLNVDTSRVSAGQIRANRDDITRIVHNLLDNARRHAHSSLAISVHSHNGRVDFAVDDDGDGIDPADHQRIFERFGRADDARSRDHGGTGLGRAIVSELASANGGTLDVGRSDELGGARFTISFHDARLESPTT